MIKVINIRHNACESSIILHCKDDKEFFVSTISYEGLCGDAPRKYWEEAVEEFSKEDANKILDFMDTYQVFCRDGELSTSEIAEDESLRCVETIDVFNRTKRVIVGFGDFERLIKIAQKHNLTPVFLCKKEGHSYYIRQEMYYHTNDAGSIHHTVGLMKKDR